MGHYLLKINQNNLWELFLLTIEKEQLKNYLLNITLQIGIYLNLKLYKLLANSNLI